MQPLRELVMATSAWPPRSRDALVNTYADAELLGWPLFVGTEPMNADRVQHVFARNPTTALLAACTKFDAVTASRRVVADALVRLDRMGAVLPCLLYRETGTFLVARGSGAHVSALAGVQVMAGADARITLPPTHGARWDTPPWHLTKRAPLELSSAAVLHSCLEEGLRLYPRREAGADHDAGGPTFSVQEIDEGHYQPESR